MRSTPADLGKVVEDHADDIAFEITDPANPLRLTIGLAKQEGRVARHPRGPLVPKSPLTMEGATP